MRQPNVSVYGTKSCPDTVRATEFLDEQGVPYEFKDLDQFPEFNAYIADLNHGKRVMPTIQVENDFLFNPDNTALSEAVKAASVSR
jgi:thioredoxin reductase (NADPH)